MGPRNPEEMMKALAASMEERTGRTTEGWTALVRASEVDPLDQNAVRRWLQAEHGLPQNSRYAVAWAAAREAGWTPPTLEEQIASQYAGSRAHLRPVFDALRSILEALGDDVTLEPRKSYVPFVRARQFAAVAAATRDRVDVGLRYTDPPSSNRLRASGAPGQGTHSLRLTDPEEVDAEVRDLLRAAYDQNG